MIRFNANLFRIAFLCASKEETRYYLQGVYVEPHHKKGVTLTTTNGHKLISIHDESGFADECAIINLGDSIKLCKPKRGERRDVIVYTGGQDAAIVSTTSFIERDKTETLTDTPIGMAYKVKIDGCFPGYRRVIPRSFNNCMAPAFASQFIAELSLVGAELAAHFHDFNAKTHVGNDRKDAMQISAGADDDRPQGSPALFHWPLMPQAVAILMPVAHKGNVATLPAWFSRSPVAAKPAAQAAE